METAVAHLAKLDRTMDVLRYLMETGHRFGVVRQSYHFTPLFHSPVSADTIVYTDGYSKEWVELYENQNFRLHDPIPRLTLEKGEPLLWKDAMAMDGATPEQRAYFAAMKRHGLIHGLGLPLYGPTNRTAYSSFDFDRPLTAADYVTVEILRGVAQAGHSRICTIFDERHGTVSLSERERQVMLWITRGKSNTDIGTILDISPETVRTYNKRIYEKLDVSDRVGAAVKALQMGLVHM